MRVKKLRYKDLSAVGESVCLTLFKKKFALESLLELWSVVIKFKVLVKIDA